MAREVVTGAQLVGILDEYPMPGRRRYLRLLAPEDAYGAEALTLSDAGQPICRRGLEQPWEHCFELRKSSGINVTLSCSERVFTQSERILHRQPEPTGSITLPLRKSGAKVLRPTPNVYLPGLPTRNRTDDIPPTADGA